MVITALVISIDFISVVSLEFESKKELAYFKIVDFKFITALVATFTVVDFIDAELIIAATIRVTVITARVIIVTVRTDFVVVVTVRLRFLFLNFLLCIS